MIVPCPESGRKRTKKRKKAMGFISALLDPQLHPKERNIPLSEFWLLHPPLAPILLPQDCLEAGAQKNGIKGGKKWEIPHLWALGIIILLLKADFFWISFCTTVFSSDFGVALSPLIREHQKKKNIVLVWGTSNSGVLPYVYNWKSFGNWSGNVPCSTWLSSDSLTHLPSTCQCWPGWPVADSRIPPY